MWSISERRGDWEVSGVEWLFVSCVYILFLVKSFSNNYIRIFYLTRWGKMVLKKFLLVGLVCVFLAPTNIFAATDAEELSAIKNEFGAVLSLKGTARKEINAIANLFAPGSKLAAIDETKASGEYCMLETVTKHNMIHYASSPEKTHEDIVYYLNPKTFIESGMDVNKLPKHLLVKVVGVFLCQPSVKSSPNTTEEPINKNRNVSASKNESFLVFI